MDRIALWRLVLAIGTRGIAGLVGQIEADLAPPIEDFNIPLPRSQGFKADVAAIGADARVADRAGVAEGQGFAALGGAIVEANVRATPIAGEINDVAGRSAQARRFEGRLGLAEAGQGFETLLGQVVEGEFLDAAPIGDQGQVAAIAAEGGLAVLETAVEGTVRGLDGCRATASEEVAQQNIEQKQPGEPRDSTHRI
jgi:hypothetical protein